MSLNQRWSVAVTAGLAAFFGVSWLVWPDPYGAEVALLAAWLVLGPLIVWAERR